MVIDGIFARRERREIAHDQQHQIHTDKRNDALQGAARGQLDQNNLATTTVTRAARLVHTGTPSRGERPAR